MEFPIEHEEMYKSVFESYILEDNLKIAKTGTQLWNLLRMKIPLNMPCVQIEWNQCKYPFMKYYKDNLRYLYFTDYDTDQMLHLCFEKIIEKFPNLEELALNWYCDDDNEDAIQYDKLFSDILKSKIQKFELNPVKKMRGFTIQSKE